MFSRPGRFADSRLVRQTLHGRRDSFDRLVERHIHGVYAVALARTQNHADAEDVVQDAFIQAYTALDQLREPGKFSGWVTTIARNGASKLMVRRKRELDSLATQSGTPEPATPDPSQGELHALLREQLDGLDADAREILLLHYFAGYSAREIAARLEISREAALKRLQRSREKLAAVLVERLEGALEGQRGDVKKLAGRIALLVAAISAPWASQQVAAASAGRWLMVTGGAMACVALVSILIWRSFDFGAEPIQNVPPADVTRDEEPAVEPASVVVASTPPVEAVEEVATPEASMVVEETPKSLEGWWTLHSPRDQEILSDWPASATVALSQRGNEVTMVEISPGSVKTQPSRGTIEEDRVTFPMLDVIAIAYDVEGSAAQAAKQPLFSGHVNASYTRIRLDGELPDYHDPDGAPPQQIGVLMKRLDGEQTTREQAIQAAAADAQRVRDAILEYAYDHRGRLPATLAELVPRYLDDLALVTDDAFRSLEYNAKAHDLMSAARSSSEFKDYRPDLSPRERLLQWEQDLTEFYGEQFPSPEDLLRVRVSNSPVEIRMTFHGEPTIVDPERSLLGQPKAILGVDQTARAEAGACMQQIKEVGLQMAWFWEVTEGQYNPAGWRTLVPEFVNDPSKLTCPSHDHGTLSYEIVFPAASRAELVAIDADVRALPVESVDPSGIGARIPLVYETAPHVIDGREFRVVLFLDGHVGLFHDRDWAKFVEPYLAYSVQ